MASYLRERIYNQNPWWKNAGEIESDPRITEYNSNPVRYTPAVIRDIDLSAPAIITLRGPRQVGKSTAVKLMIKELLLRAKVDPQSILFYSADDLESPRDIYRLITEYHEIRQELGELPKLEYIFLDEITSVPDWQKGIKTLYEEGKISRSALLVTGSSAVDLRRGAERLPGRRGKDPCPDKTILPLSFFEYLAAGKFADLDLIGEMPSFWDLLERPALVKKLQPLDKLRGSLRRWLAKYRLSGGFPRAVNDLLSLKKVSQVTYEIYLDWLRGDITKFGRSEHIARQILYEIAGLLCARVEWQTIAKKIEIEAHTTVMDYALLLEDIFAIRIFYQMDFHKKKIQPKKRKKIYFLDPLIFWAVLGWNEKWGDFFARAQEKTPALLPALAEGLVAQHLARVDLPDWTSPAVFFWHNAREIDFLIFNRRGEIIPIEVKFQEKVGRYDFLPLKKSGFKQGWLISKNDLLIEDNFAALPLELFLSIIR